MNREAVAAHIESTCRELGLSSSATETIVRQVQSRPFGPDDLAEENARLREEIQRVRSENARMSVIQREVMELLKSRSPDKIIHDLRNVLNELTLLQAVADQVEE